MVSLSVRPSICKRLGWSVIPSVSQSVHPSVSLSVHPFTQPAHPSICLSISQSLVCQSASLPASWSVCFASISLSFSQINKHSINQSTHQPLDRWVVKLSSDQISIMIRICHALRFLFFIQIYYRLRKQSTGKQHLVR